MDFNIANKSAWILKNIQKEFTQKISKTENANQ